MNNKFLVVANAYPSEHNIYRNGFIHSRVKSYIQRGFMVEVFYLHPPKNEIDQYFFEGVQVTIGNEKVYSDYIKENSFDNYLIHFISPEMYYPIIENNKNPNITLWIHGFEAENWHRRWFNFLEDPTSLSSILKKATEYYPKQLSFMNSIYNEDKINIKFVYVSRWFKENIADIDAKAAPQRYEIIPNIINGNVFDFIEKESEQRTKILSIRSYASKKYANDLSIEAVKILSKKPFFKELEFAFYGDGRYFSPLMNQISKFENVSIHKGFLKQSDIATVHKEYGIFLCPTRLDSQGVSMCEAMSSGLVVVASDNTAIPEFVDHKVTGLLSKSESAESIAYEIERMYFNKELFKEISENAANSIRKIADNNVVIDKELEVILDV